MRVITPEASEKFLVSVVEGKFTEVHLKRGLESDLLCLKIYISMTCQYTSQSFPPFGIDYSFFLGKD